jgi:hypothetical protein
MKMQDMMCLNKQYFIFGKSLSDNFASTWASQRTDVLPKDKPIHQHTNVQKDNYNILLIVPTH